VLVGDEDSEFALFDAECIAEADLVVGGGVSFSDKKILLVAGDELWFSFKD